MKQEIKRAFLLLPAAFIANTGIGILNFSLVFYMRDVFNLSSAGIGWFSSLWAFSYFIGCSALHGLSRKVGAPFSIAFAVFGMTITVIIMMLSHSAILMFVLYSLFGFLTAMFWPPLMGWLSEGLEGHELNRMIGFFNLSWSTGLVLSPYLGGLLLELNFIYPFVSIIIMYSVLMISLFVFPIIIPSIIKVNKQGNVKLTDSDHSTPLRYAAWLGNLTGYIIFGIIMFVFPLYARKVLHFSESSIGLLLLFRALFSTFVFIIIGKISVWHFKKPYILILQALLVLFAFSFSYFRSWLEYAAVLSLFGILFAGGYSSSIFHGVSGSINRERRMVIHESVLTLGVVLGATAGGEIYQRWGIAAAFYTAGAAAGLIMIIQIVIMGIQYKKLTICLK